uniref:Ribosomal protein L6 n=1 Tax=Analipus japonicus TaxID=31333 RepID=A0A8F0FD20_9PHAE|nr:ribosomal protein L6 [Analipus japonicus]
MTIPVFRLPIGVGCSSIDGKVRVSGACGVVAFNSVSKVYRKGNLAIFLPYLSPYYSSIFTQAALGVVLGYTVELKLKGVGYRVREEKGELIFSLGYTRPVILMIPKDISISIEKKSFFLRSANFGLLQNFATTIRNYRFPDSYKGAGVLYGGEVIVCKEGKKS